ncbi:probable methyltransferase-like protein 25 [Cylas formicarius]|uniref:probable methyltransferase-like protein 25 n=1 Tax=Cylas formicarius TaxID=197179 RepID=UPI002958B03F|nr:probable methyltransferase-like protein 25 [Cylas formicarius]
MTQIKAVIKQIESVIHHLDTYLPLANAHMVEYFTKDTFNIFMPADVASEIQEFGCLEIIESIFAQELKNKPNIKDFIDTNERMSLKNIPICLSLKQFQKSLMEMGSSELSSLKLDIFMNSKKSHEVEILSCIIAALKEVSRISHVIDIGDGKGYLSSMLALNYQIPVLGIDASKVNTEGSVQRARKLAKVWNRVVNNEKRRETYIDHYKQITQFVDENTDFNRLVVNVFLESPNGMGIVGLHTCGNLGPACLEIFHKTQDVQLLCNVGCCYHFLTELTDGDANNVKFPMSGFLKTKQYKLGRAARMIGCQSIERILHKRELPSKTIFQRALFEIVLEKSSTFVPYENRQVGRFRKECVTFLEYAKAASKRINFDLTMSDEEIDLLFREYESRVNELNLFYLMKSMLGPAIESLILLDRLLFLQENGYTSSYIVQLFDPVVSPRCYGIIALKPNAL